MACWSCGAELKRKGSGPPPSRYCSHACRQRDKRRRYKRRSEEDREILAALLHELAPEGLTNDCPARRA